MSEKEWFVPGSFNISRGQATIYEWNDAVATALAESKAAIVRIGKWNDSSLDVLSAFADQIECLYIECDIPDLSGLSELRNVRTLSLNAGAETVDWSRIRQLENLSIWAAHPTFGNLAACRSLKTLSITDCGLRDLEPVAGLQGLEELLVFEAPFRSLRGIERLPSLRRLVLQQVPLKSLAGLHQAQSLSEFVVERVSRLESIKELTELPALRSVSVGASRKIGDLERLGAVRQLEQLEIERRPLPSTAFITQLTGLRKLRLESVGKLPSVEFLRPLEALEVFEPAENTTFVDGDLSVLLEPPELREVWFMDRRHYSHRREEIMKTLLGRRTWGPGVFENERAVRWSEELLKAYRDPWNPLRLVSFAVAAIVNLSTVETVRGQPIPALIGQVGLAAAEVVACLLGRRGDRSGQVPAAEEWVRAHADVPVPAELVDMTVQALDRVVRPPSGLLEVWEEREQASAWLEAVGALRSRVAG